MPAKIIVAATPPDAAADAVALAVDLARARGASLLVAGVAVVPMMADREVFARAQRGAMERELSLLVPHDTDGVEAGIAVVVSRSITRGLHSLAEREHADLLVMGPTHRGTIERVFQGDLILSTLHGSTCPIAVAPAGYADRTSEDRPMMGVAIDGGEESDAVLDAAVTLAEQMGASLRIVHVAETPIGYAVPPWLDAAGSARYLEAVRAEGNAVLQRAEEKVDGRVPVSTKLLSGLPGEELARFGSEVDLLVMGSRAYGTVGRVIVGSTAGRVLHDAPCAVLVLPQTVLSEVPALT
ncbi:universal stress protein [Paraconexibacter sp.]|uniref:universal stress protein n=1 Tax=Paraconexibacter sp. TaxID=2949640 RepID=UPI00356745C1